jgi:hypothetical protein
MGQFDSGNADRRIVEGLKDLKPAIELINQGVIPL